MAVALPTLPTIWEAKPRLVQFNTMLTPTLGGPEQRVQRMGTRFAVDITLPALNPTSARSVLAAVLKAQSLGSTVTVAWPQLSFATAIGTPLVNGASQTGSSLVIDGLTPSVTIPAGVFFSVTVSGRSYLYAVTDAVTANGSGQATLSIAPMLRASPADNAALSFATPTIEGFLPDSAASWSLEMLTSSSFTLSIQEVQ